jgi:hypothetical protein
MSSPLDPFGKLAHQPGAKLDAGKIKAGLMVSGFANALSSVAEVTTFGANKYTPNGWLSVPDASVRYTDALYRHLFQSTHTKNDVESNISHLAHAAWNCLAILELQLKKELSEQKESDTQI